jgi:hypothetical protein
VTEEFDAVVVVGAGAAGGAAEAGLSVAIVEEDLIAPGAREAVTGGTRCRRIVVRGRGRLDCERRVRVGARVPEVALWSSPRAAEQRCLQIPGAARHRSLDEP